MLMMNMCQMEDLSSISQVNRKPLINSFVKEMVNIVMVTVIIATFINAIGLCVASKCLPLTAISSTVSASTITTTTTSTAATGATTSVPQSSPGLLPLQQLPTPSCYC